MVWQSVRRTTTALPRTITRTVSRYPLRYTKSGVLADHLSRFNSKPIIYQFSVPSKSQPPPAPEEPPPTLSAGKVRASKTGSSLGKPLAIMHDSPCRINWRAVIMGIMATVPFQQIDLFNDPLVSRGVLEKNTSTFDPRGRRRHRRGAVAFVAGNSHVSRWQSGSGVSVGRF